MVAQLQWRTGRPWRGSNDIASCGSWFLGSTFVPIILPDKLPDSTTSTAQKRSIAACTLTLFRLIPQTAAEAPST